MNDNPGQASSHAWYGSYLSDIGRSEEAIQELNARGNSTLCQ